MRAFVPHPLPPVPEVDFREDLRRPLEAATTALGRLDAVTELLPDATIFVYGYVRKEAVLSSQIEGTQSSLSDLMLHEAGGATGAPVSDVLETSNAVAALNHGVERLRGGFPLSNRLMREMHAKLLATGPGAAMMPGEFRRSQNWIGGSRPGNAAFVPPPPNHVQDCMAGLERFIHATDDGLPVLVKAALAHVQFETIHPFLDGNGRLGRLLITLMLCDAGLLREPLLYLSLYFKRNRSTYYQLLNDIRHTGDWEAWLRFFLEGVGEVAEAACRDGPGRQRDDPGRPSAHRQTGTAGGFGAAGAPVPRRTPDRGHPPSRTKNRPVRADRGRRAPASRRTGYRARSHGPPAWQDLYRMRGIWPFCGRGRRIHPGRNRPIRLRTVSFASRPTAVSVPWPQPTRALLARALGRMPSGRPDESPASRA